MKKSIIFPIPGGGNFIRQPLYVRDFCKIIESGLFDKSLKGKYEITGLERISYRRLMKELKLSVKSTTIFVNLPIPIFAFLLKIWALISEKPAFTTSQLYSLIAGDQFEIIDWQNIFNVKSTPFKEALIITHNHKKYSKISRNFIKIGKI